MKKPSGIGFPHPCTLAFQNKPNPSFLERRTTGDILLSLLCSETGSNSKRKDEKKVQLMQYKRLRRCRRRRPDLNSY